MPKLLLAVDSETIRRVLELTFAASAIEVVTAAGGDEAIARIPVERPDVVLADIALPQRSGYDVAAFVKADPALAKTRVLLLAGAFEPVDEAKAAAVGSDGVLAKPFEPRQVLARVSQLLGVDPAMAAPPAAVVEERPAPSPPLEFPRRDAGAAVPVDHELDEYFEQLDAAFDSLGVDPTASGRLADPLPSLDDQQRQSVPTVDRLVGEDEAKADAARSPFDLATAGEPPTRLRTRPTPPAGAEPQKVGTIADAFASLLAHEQGDRTVPPVRLVPAPRAIGEDVIEDITRRVLARLAPGTVRDVVADVVSEVAERLVRQEIERIRKNS